MKYIVEHMETMPMSEWVTLEYKKMLQDVGKENLLICSLPNETKTTDIAEELIQLGLQWTTLQLDEIHTKFPSFTNIKDKKMCLLDPRGDSELSCEDINQFEVCILGGILGSHPPRDRTNELKDKYPGLLVGKRLGALQMSTDTACRCAHYILDKQIPFDEIKFIDYPEIRFSKREAVEMPFRYILDDVSGKPILPDGMLKLMKKDSQQSIEDLF
ncbi:hypothetical protein QEN19_001126 [Hanseniaspora menglaensis]